MKHRLLLLLSLLLLPILLFPFFAHAQTNPIFVSVGTDRVDYYKGEIITVTGKVYTVAGPVSPPVTNATVTVDMIVGTSSANLATNFAVDSNGRYTISSAVLNPLAEGPGTIKILATKPATAADPTEIITAQTSPITLHLGINPNTTKTPATTAPAAAQSTATVQLPNPIACNDATCLIGQVVRYILGTIAVIATLMFVWGGVMMLTSGGNADQVKRAKETLVWATIGVVVILLSWVIIQTVLQALTKTTS